MSVLSRSHDQLYLLLIVGPAKKQSFVSVYENEEIFPPLRVRIADMRQTFNLFSLLVLLQARQPPEQAEAVPDRGRAAAAAAAAT